MTYESSGHITELDEWADKQVLYPYGEAWLALHEPPDQETKDVCKEHLTRVEAEIKKSVRQKVLESYRNGQNAGAPKPAFRCRQYKPQQ